ncbi:MAG TPA: flagellar motor switch protein FliM [Clostridiales bacterium]|nr:flagellar motor switch protein FliM [Clostridiales bacterium]
MSDILSQSQIDELLRALNTGEINVAQIKEEEQDKKIKEYDFKRPNKFAKEQLRTLQIIYENFARLLSSYLSGHLRTYCQIDVVSVEQLTYYEYNNSLAEPVLLNIIDFSPLDGSLIIDIDSGIAFGIIDRMLGGPGKLSEKTRNFTELELTLLERILKGNVIRILKESWTNVLEINPSLSRIETNAQFAQIVSPNETIALVTMSVGIGELNGMINCCIPHIVIEPILDNLNTKFWFSKKKSETSAQSYYRLLEGNIRKTALWVRGVLGNSTITVKDFLELAVGDVIKLDNRTDSKIPVYVEDFIKFYGIVGSKNNRMAIKITEVEEEEQNG